MFFTVHQNLSPILLGHREQAEQWVHLHTAKSLKISSTSFKSGDTTTTTHKRFTENQQHIFQVISDHLISYLIQFLILHKRRHERMSCRFCLLIYLLHRRSTKKGDMKKPFEVSIVYFLYVYISNITRIRVTWYNLNLHYPKGLIVSL